MFFIAWRACITFMLSSLFVIVGSGIIGGTPAYHYPFFVIVGMFDETCGGTLVAPDAIVTAAHCLFYEDENRWARPKEVYVIKSYFTEWHWQHTSSTYSCRYYVYHQSFNPKPDHACCYPFDIAVIKLDESIDISRSENGILKPCPEENRKAMFASGFAIGMGLTRKNPEEDPEVLMGTWLYRHNNCGAYFKRRGLRFDQKSQFCFGSLNQDRLAALCDGDSGGPLIHTGRSSLEAVCLIGIASYGANSCKNTQIPDVFTNAGYFAEWIEDSIKTCTPSSMTIKSACNVMK